MCVFLDTNILCVTKLQDEYQPCGQGLILLYKLSCCVHKGRKGGQHFPDQLLSTSWPVWYDTQEVRHFQFSICQVHRYSLIVVSRIVYILFPALFLSVSHAGAPAVLGLSRSVLSEVFSVFWLLIDASKCFRMSKHVPVMEPVFKWEGLLGLCCVFWESNHDFYVPASIHSKIACFSTLSLTTVTPGSSEF